MLLHSRSGGKDSSRPHFSTIIPELFLAPLRGDLGTSNVALAENATATLENVLALASASLQFRQFKALFWTLHYGIQQVDQL